MAVRLGSDYMNEMSPDVLRAMGVTFVSRYLSDFPSKNLSLLEAQHLTWAGIDIVSNWEDDIDTWQGGYARGVRDARTAWAEHKACGGPDGRPIYFSVDEDVNPQNQTLHDYFRGLGDGMTPGQIGVYGSTAVCRALKAAGLVHWTWRTMSTGWSGGSGDPSEFNVEQTGFINNNMDRDASITDDFGQWRVGGPTTPASNPTPTPSVEDDLPTPQEVWAYSHGDRPDVHQTLLDAKNNSANAAVSVWSYKNADLNDAKDMRQRIVDLEAKVDRLIAKLGA